MIQVKQRNANKTVTVVEHYLVAVNHFRSNTDFFIYTRKIVIEALKHIEVIDCY